MTGQFPDPAPFVEQANKILDLADKRNLTLRLLGAIAFHVRCPEFNYIHKETQRLFTDIDFMAYSQQMAEIEQMFRDMGYVEDRRIKSVPGLRRSIFFHQDHGWHTDVFYDVLEFSHEINFRGRLELNHPTISLVDLLLEKMQIAQINEKDIIDTLILLREHDVSNLDDNAIRIDYLAQTCKADWGLWRTVTNNLAKVNQLADKYDVLTADDRRIIRDRLQSIVTCIDEEPPTLRWRLRDRIGERIKWYRDVDEVT
ncbi:MAG: hypothetical protein OES46_04560 [Gammaproteobacteria bacterium]|jgi:hypothetical protein|nr:hypothetical protein [Gammaproteobacteria bacterium]